MSVIFCYLLVSSVASSFQVCFLLTPSSAPSVALGRSDCSKISAFLYPDSFELNLEVTSLGAVGKTGQTLSPLNPQQTSEDLDHITHAQKAPEYVTKFVCQDREHAQKATCVIRALPVLIPQKVMLALICSET